MSKQWMAGHDWECPACGCEIEIFTDAHEWAGKGDIGKHVIFWDGDDARCPECPWRGGMQACEDDCGVSDGNLDDLHDCETCDGVGMDFGISGEWQTCIRCDGHGYILVQAAA